MLVTHPVLLAGLLMWVTLEVALSCIENSHFRLTAAY